MEILDLFKKKVEKQIDFSVAKHIDGNYDDFKNRLKKDSLIVLITGKRGSGKTALGFKFLELVSGKRKAYYLGKAKLPRFIKKVDDIKEVRNDSVVLVDEAAITYSARSSMKKSNKILSELMTIARHKGLSLIIITQSCMPLKTKIITEKGVQSLGKLKMGDKVLSYNIKKRRLEFKKVFAISPIKKQRVIEIQTQDGKIIKCSPEHKLIVKKEEKLIKKKAKDLTEKDILFKPLNTE
ncbi:MAG: Hint domain-containing protein [archaeon]